MSSRPVVDDWDDEDDWSDEDFAKTAPLPPVDLGVEALSLARRGFYVFPCRPHGKIPAIGHGHLRATTNPETITKWWSKDSRYNIGCALGVSGLIVVDVDVPDALADIEMPVTLTQATPRGGYHLIYLAPEWSVANTVGRLPGVGYMKGVDIRGEGGYIIIAPSQGPQVMDEQAKRYEWTAPLGVSHPIAMCPDWLRDADGDPHRGFDPDVAMDYREVMGDTYLTAALEDEIGQVLGAREGHRNHVLNTAAFCLGQLIHQGLDRSIAVNGLIAAGMLTGLERDECEKTVRSGIDAGYSKPRGR